MVLRFLVHFVAVLRFLLPPDFPLTEEKWTMVNAAAADDNDQIDHSYLELGSLLKTL